MVARPSLGDCSFQSCGEEGPVYFFTEPFAHPFHFPPEAQVLQSLIEGRGKEEKISCFIINVCFLF